MCSSSISNFDNILCVPPEVLTKILLHCEVIDILSFCCTCKHLNSIIDNAYFWKQKWKQIASTSKFTLPDVTDIPASLLKKACIRYYVVVAENENDHCTFPSCYICDSFTCVPGCFEEWKPKLVVDLGSKVTRIFNTATTDIGRHLSVFRMPEKCFQPGKEGACFNVLQPHVFNVSNPKRCNCNPDSFICFPEDVDSSDVMKSNCKTCDDVFDHQSRTLMTDSRSFCVTCSSIHYPSAPCKDLNPTLPSISRGCFKNELCISMQESCNHLQQILSPGMGMQYPVGFPYLVTSYLREVLVARFKKSIDLFTLRAPGSTVFICVPNSGSPPAVCKSILSFLFVEMKVGRVCLIPKALGLAKTQSASCCIVVDSGAFSTSVAIVIDEKVVAVKDIPVGGWHLSKELHAALVTRGCISPEVKVIHEEKSSAACCSNRKKLLKREADGPPYVPVVSFDEASVKSKCRLSPLLYSKKPITVPSQTQTVYLNRLNTPNKCSKDLIQVCLKNEFTAGPEVHFAALDLPRVILSLTEGLPYKLKRLCLSNILLTGGNGSLNGLVARLGCELRNLLPDFHDSISVILPFGPSDLHTVMGVSLVEYNYNRTMNYADDIRFQSYCNLQERNPEQPFHLCSGGKSQLPRPHRKGDPFWLSREEFIVFGPDF